MRYQSTFSDVEYLNRKRISKREEFLDSMNEIVPWDRWIGLIKPFYPNGKRGRPTRGIETMLRMYLLQIWFNLSDEGMPSKASTGTSSLSIESLLSDAR